MRQQARSEETRNKILEAARNCFSLSGYEPASVDDICKTAGITKGAFYYHFTSKQALFIELQNIWFSKFDDNLIQSISEDTIQERMADLQTVVGGIFKNAEINLPILLEFWMNAIRNPKIKQGLDEHYHHFVELIAGQIKEGAGEDAAKIKDPVLIARAIIGLILGLMLQGALNPQSADWTIQIRNSVEMLLTGLQLG